MENEFNNNFNDGSKTEEKKSENNSDYVYQTVMGEKKKSRIFSILSFVISLVSLVMCISSWTALVLGVGGIVFAVVSRKSLGYFDGFTLAGLIIGIIATVFAFAGVIFDMIFVGNDILSNFMKEFEGIFQDYSQQEPGGYDSGNGNFV